MNKNGHVVLKNYRSFTIKTFFYSTYISETIRHLVPLLCEGFLKQHFERISCPVIFVFSFHERSFGHARAFVLKRNKLETQLFVPWPRWGHALRRQGADHSDNTDPDFMSITQRIQIIERWLTQNNRDTVKLVFYPIRK